MFSSYKKLLLPLLFFSVSFPALAMDGAEEPAAERIPTIQYAQNLRVF